MAGTTEYIVVIKYNSIGYYNFMKIVLFKFDCCYANNYNMGLRRMIIASILTDFILK